MSVDAMRAWRLGLEAEAASQRFGTSTIPDDLASKLLAWALVMGDTSAETTHGPALAYALGRAARKFRLMGGETPDPRGARLVRERAAELRRLGKETPWLREVTGRYVDGVFTRK